MLNLNAMEVVLTGIHTVQLNVLIVIYLAQLSIFVCVSLLEPTIDRVDLLGLCE